MQPQVQSKLTFQATPKKQSTAEEQPVNDDAKAAKHMPRAPIIRRQRPPTKNPLSKPQRYLLCLHFYDSMPVHHCSIQEQLCNIEDSQALLLCLIYAVQT